MARPCVEGEKRSVQLMVRVTPTTDRRMRKLLAQNENDTVSNLLNDLIKDWCDEWESADD